MEGFAAMEKLEGALLLTTELDPQLAMADAKGPNGKYKKLEALYQDSTTRKETSLSSMDRYRSSTFKSEQVYKAFLEAAGNSWKTLGS